MHLETRTLLGTTSVQMHKTKYIIEIEMAGRQKYIKFMKLAPMLYTVLNYES